MPTLPTLSCISCLVLLAIPATHEPLSVQVYGTHKTMYLSLCLSDAAGSKALKADARAACLEGSGVGPVEKSIREMDAALHLSNAPGGSKLQKLVITTFSDLGGL